MLWNVIAKLLCVEYITAWLIRNGTKLPYFHIDGYMDRWWILPGAAAGSQAPRWLRWCPVSIRLHHIKRGDKDQHLHDHPFDYRTICLRNGYIWEDVLGNFHLFKAGETHAARAEEFHRIHLTHSDGAWTLFFMFKRKHRWGFLVSGHKVEYPVYLRQHEWSLPLNVEMHGDAWAVQFSRTAPMWHKYARWLAGAPKLGPHMSERWWLEPNADGTAVLRGVEEWK